MPERHLLLLTLNTFHTFYNVSIVDFEYGNVSWGRSTFELPIKKCR